MASLNQDFAFPYGVSDDGVMVVWQTGLTKREYFAAHCPKEIPSWFNPEPCVPRPGFPDWQALPTKALRDAAREWKNDGVCDIGGMYSHPENCEVVSLEEAHRLLSQFEDETHRVAEALEAWNTQNQAWHYFAWRLYYADQMILALGKTEGETNG